MSLATLASAVGLLLRLDWARRTFIGLLAVAIVMNLLGLWLQQEVVQSVVHNTLSHATLSAQVLGVFGGFVTAARVMAVLMTLAACALLAWIIGRLMSEAVRQEFA
jgi:ABC-type Mn2+/Zn2+ transport system permease subunit